MAWSTRSRFKPHIIIVASSMPSGRSWAWRMLSAGKLRMELSSLMVPLSESTAFACICKWT